MTVRELNALLDHSDLLTSSERSEILLAMVALRRKRSREKRIEMFREVVR